MHHVHRVAQARDLGFIPIVFALEGFNARTNEVVRRAANVKVGAEIDNMVVQGCVNGWMDTITVFICRTVTVKWR